MEGALWFVGIAVAGSEPPQSEPNRNLTEIVPARLSAEDRAEARLALDDPAPLTLFELATRMALALQRPLYLAEGMSLHRRRVLVEVGPQEPTDEEWWEVFCSALRAAGFEATHREDGVFIEPLERAKCRECAAESEVRVTRLFRPDISWSVELVPLLGGMLSPDADKVALEATQSLIVTDIQDNVSKVQALFYCVDWGDGPEVSMHPLRYARADDVRMIVELLVGGSALVRGEPAPGGVALTDDLQTNSLLVVGDDRAQARVRDILVHLDRDGLDSLDPANRRRWHLFPLEHALAEEAATNLELYPPEEAGYIEVLAGNEVLAVAVAPSGYEALAKRVADLDRGWRQVLVSGLLLEFEGRRRDWSYPSSCVLSDEACSAMFSELDSLEERDLRSAVPLSFLGRADVRTTLAVPSSDGELLSVSVTPHTDGLQVLLDVAVEPPETEDSPTRSSRVWLSVPASQTAAMAVASPGRAHRRSRTVLLLEPTPLEQSARTPELQSLACSEKEPCLPELERLLP